MDCISRKAAIDAMGKKFDEIYKTKQKGATYPHGDFFQGMAYAESVVKQLPSAQPKIIRCRDCKEYSTPDHRCRWWNHETNEAGWCYVAERMENG